MANKRLPTLTSDLKQLVCDIDEFGYCLLADAIPNNLLAGMRDSLVRLSYSERTQNCEKGSEISPCGHQWVYLLINKGHIFRYLLLAETVQSVLRHVLSTDYILSEFAATIAHPGNEQMPLHIDQWWMPADQKRAINRAVACNALWLISDFRRDNGATRIAPRSHLAWSDTNGNCAFGETVNVVAPAGSCLIFEGRTAHGT